MVFTSTAKHKMYHKTFVIQHAISYLDTYLSTNRFTHSITNFRKILVHETFHKLILIEFHY